MAVRWKMGGIDSGTMYGQFALEVAREAVLREREQCAIVCERAGEALDASERWGLRDTDGKVARECAAAIRARFAQVPP